MVIDRYPLSFGSRLKIIDNNFYTINGDIYNYENQPLKIGSLRNINEVIVYAKSLIGCPYRWGGKTSGGFDCSGFVQSVYLAAGILLPRDSWQQSEFLIDRRTEGDLSKPGDLHFFGKNGKISHVGISTGGFGIIHCQGWVKEEIFSFKLRLVIKGPNQYVVLGCCVSILAHQAKPSLFPKFLINLFGLFDALNSC